MQTALLAILAAISVAGVGALGAGGMIANPVMTGTMGGMGTAMGGGMMNGGSCGMNGGMMGNMGGGMMNGACDMEQMQAHMQDCTMAQGQCQCERAAP
jgi:hypothetical protein